MSDPFEKLVTRLSRQTGVSAHEIADAYWLVSLGVVAAARTDITPQSPRFPSTSDLPPPKQPPPPPDHGQTRDKAADSIGVHAPAPGGASLGLPVRLPGTVGLGRPLVFDRVFRTWRIREADRRIREVDEEASIIDYLETGTVAVAYRPQIVHRWDVVTLIIERSPTMRIWQRTGLDFLRTLQRAAGTRRVELHYLEWTASRPQLFSATNFRRSAQSIVVPGERQVVLLLSDARSNGWLDGSIPELLQRWSRSVPTTLVQPLAARLWRNTSLRDFQLSGISAAAERMPPLVCGLNPSELGELCRFLSARPAGSRAAALLRSPTALKRSFPASRGPRKEPNADKIERLFDSFRKSTGHLTYELALYLSTVPLTLSLMQYVQAALVPEANPSNLAELFFSGLIRRIQPSSGPEPTTLQEIEAIRYEFLPGVDDQLRNEGGIDRQFEAIRVVSEYIERRAGSSRDFMAYVFAGDDAEENDATVPLSDEFRQIADVLRYHVRAGRSLYDGSVATSTARRSGSANVQKEPAPSDDKIDEIPSPPQKTSGIRVYVSATRHDLGSYRTVVAEWARSHGHDVVLQEEFPVPSNFDTIAQMLRDKVAACDAVIHLAGLFYGFEPTNIPPGELRRSYTQLEYELGKELRRQVFRFVARDDYQPDNPINQSKGQESLQRQHRQRLVSGSDPYSLGSRKSGSECYYEFSTPEELRQLLEKIDIRKLVFKPNNLPYDSLGNLFNGRDDVLYRLRKSLQKPARIAALTGSHVIHGLGGVGKTRVALEYGWRNSEDYDALLFVTADSPENLDRSLASLCGALVLNLPEQASPEQATQVAAAVRWLNDHDRWYLVLDNVDTERAMEAVQHYLKYLNSGHVVITSRISEWPSDVESFDLGVHSVESAASFLLERTSGRRPEVETDVEDAKLLAEDLGCLALALEQASAYIIKRRITLDSYRTRWREQEPKVLEWFHEPTMQYPKSVATTWVTSIEGLSGDGKRLLDILSWLASDSIPLAFVEKLSERQGRRETEVEEGIADLAAYSLARWTDDGEGVQVHGLVQEIGRYRQYEGEWAASLQAVLDAVDAWLPPEAEDVRFWPLYHAIYNHAVAAIGHAEQFDSPPPCSRILNKLGVYLKSRAEFAHAEAILRRALAIDEASYGADHPHSAQSLSNLAELLRATNRLSEAEPLYRRALAIDEASYGAEHPSVARDLNNLAMLLHATNRLAEAEQLLRRALAIDEASYGAEHPYVARGLNNRAMVLQANNRLAEAEPLLRRALAIDEASYGAEHPEVARDLNNLAMLLQATNRQLEAEPLLRRALAIDEASYGAEHPNVARDLNNLAMLLQLTNRQLEAEPLLSSTLAIFGRFTQETGHQHPDLFPALNNCWALWGELQIPEEERWRKLYKMGVDPAWFKDDDEK